MKFLARLILLSLCIAGIGALMLRAIEGDTEHTSPRTDAAQPDERNLAYIATGERGPTFTLEPGEQIFRVLSYLHLDYQTSPTVYSPAQTYQYGLRWIVREANGALVREGTVWVQTRKSKADYADETWEKESVYYPVGAGPGEPCDGRLTELDLSAYAGAGRTVEIRPERADREVNLIVYEQFDRQGFDKQWLQRVLSPERRAELARQARVSEWGELSNAERSAILDRGWARQSSLVEIPTRTLYSTDFRVEQDDLPPTPGDPIGQGRALAYNVHGPATLELAVVGEPGRTVDLSADILAATGEPDAPLRFDSRDVSVAAIAQRYDHWSPIALSEASLASFEIPDGHTATVRLRADLDETLRAVAWVDRIGAISGEASAARVEGGWLMLGPDWKRFRHWELRPGEPARFTLANAGIEIGDAVRVSLRGVVPTHKTTQLEYRFYAGDEILDRGRVASPAQLSAFERLEPANPQSSLRLLTEPDTHRFWVPDGATHLELEGKNGPVIVGAAALVLGDDGLEAQPEPPYDQLPVGASWRYAPIRHKSWQSIAPDNRDALEQRDRRRTIRSQVRLRPDWSGLEELAGPDAQIADLAEDLCAGELDNCRFAQLFEPPEPRPTRGEPIVVDPLGRPRSRIVVERADLQPTNGAAVRAVRREWNPSWRASLEPGEPFPCRAPRDGTLAVELAAADLGLLGRRLAAYWNGQLIERRLLRTARSRVYLRPPTTTGSGELELRLEPTAENDAALQILADCAPARPTNSGQLVRLRRVWRLTPGRPLRLRTHTTRDEAAPIIAVAYHAASATPLRLDANVDAGDATLTRTGPVEQITAAQRTLEFEPPTATARLQRDPSTRLRGPTIEAIPLGRDWRPGRHTLELRTPTREHPGAWLRFYTRPGSTELRRAYGD